LALVSSASSRFQKKKTQRVNNSLKSLNPGCKIVLGWWRLRDRLFAIGCAEINDKPNLVKFLAIDVFGICILEV
jgi:hypothetical protein